MFNLTEEYIKERCSSNITFIRGKEYKIKKRIRSIKYDPNDKCVSAIVSGTMDYLVFANFTSDGKLLSAQCNCPAYSKYWGNCKHIVAMLLEIADRDAHGDFNELINKYTVEKIINHFRNRYVYNKIPINVEITYGYDSDKYEHSVEKYSYVSLAVGESRLYKVKSMRNFLESIILGEPMYYGKKFTFDPRMHVFKYEDRPILEMLKEIYENEEYIMPYTNRYYANSHFSRNKVFLTDSLTKKFFSILGDRPFNAMILNKSYSNIRIKQSMLPIDFTVDKADNDLLLKMNCSSDIVPLVNDGEYVFFQDEIYNLTYEQKQNFIPFYNELRRNRQKAIVIPDMYKETFVSEIYPLVKKIGDVSIDEEVEALIYKPDLKREIYFDMENDNLIAKIKFVYGDIIINPFLHDEKNVTGDERILVRDIEGENKLLKIIEEAGFKVLNGQIYLENDDYIFDFLYYTLPKIQNCAYVFYSDTFKNTKIKDASSFKSGIRLNKENDILEFSFSIDGISDDDIKEVLMSFKEKKRYLKLKDGTFIPFDVPEMRAISDIIEGLDINVKDFEDKVANIPKYKALYLDEKIKNTGKMNIKRNLQFKELVQNIKEPGDIDYSVPEELNATLRDYQKFGFKWLKTLSFYGFGGILADDMGLGKTLQVLTFILSEKNEKDCEPSLIVVPTSLVYNWHAEVEKFTPQLSVLMISGNKNERLEALNHVNNYDLVITSYPLIRRDIDYYKDIHFRFCILDEAQYIKNPQSQNAKSVKKINAKGRFALTGTPIENSLTELWSIFDFLMEGYLSNRKKFVSKFEKPIVKDQDNEAVEELRRFIRPFILRRFKKDVLKELPNKIEHKLMAELTKEQKKIYVAYLNKIRGELEQEIAEKGFKKSQIKILAALTRLRQLCCHPSLFIDEYYGESGKLNLLSEIINESLESGHRILLFSQFTGMLSIIKDMLLEKNIDFMYLDGSTKSKDRGKLVEDFNKGKGSIFLISLKAGGTGLNLTGADVVIHFDPWWNPAVEEQATDRVYRIGQKNVVQVMKIITKGTIEEKIFELQQKKKKIIDTVIKQNETLITKMSEKDIMELLKM